MLLECLKWQIIAIWHSLEMNKNYLYASMMTVALLLDFPSFFNFSLQQKAQ